MTPIDGKGLWPVLITHQAIVYQFGTNFYGYEMEFGDLAAALQAAEIPPARKTWDEEEGK